MEAAEKDRSEQSEKQWTCHKEDVRGLEIALIVSGKLGTAEEGVRGSVDQRVFSRGGTGEFHLDKYSRLSSYSIINGQVIFEISNLAVTQLPVKNLAKKAYVRKEIGLRSPTGLRKEAGVRK